MASRPPTDPTLDLDRIRKQQSKKPKRAPLRIMIATDPTRPIRTLTLPRSLPTVASVIVGAFVLATVILACGSWKLSDALSGLQRRMFAMVKAADSVALAPGGESASLGGHALLASQAPLGVAARGPSGELGRFVIQVVNTGEEMEVSLNLATGEVEAESYKRLRHLMRCQRTTAETPIDPRLIGLLYRIAQRTRQKIVLVSGFRAPMYSLATLSYHTRGMAADIRIPGMTPLMVRDLADAMGIHGVGYYPVSGFVHVDVRDEHMRWIDYGKDRQDGEGTEHGPEHGETAARDDGAAAL